MFTAQKEGGVSTGPGVGTSDRSRAHVADVASAIEDIMTGNRSKRILAVIDRVRQAGTMRNLRCAAV